VSTVSTVAAVRAARACTDCARPIPCPLGVSADWSDTFCALNGATRTRPAREVPAERRHAGRLAGVGVSMGAS
jgi:hypothetical protein